MTPAVDDPSGAGAAAPSAGAPRARQMLARARWAAHAFGTYDHTSVVRIVEAVTRAAEERAEHYARWAVEETGCGVPADKAVKNRLGSRGLLDAHGDHDFVTPRSHRGAVELPRPAGVVLALTPSRSPVSTLYATVVLSLMTRNAVVVSPHPSARGCGSDAAQWLAEAAVAAGAPDGVIQVLEDPSPAVVDALLTDDRVDVVLRTGPANVPVFVDATADLPHAAAALVASKSFDNSLLRTSESVLVVEDAVADDLQGELERHGAHVLDAAERDGVRDALFPQQHLDRSLVGRDAAGIAARAGVRVGPHTRVLVAPLDLAVDEEPLAHEKPCPVLGLVRVPTARRGIRTAAAVVRIGGAGHAAVIHSADSRTVLDFAAAVHVPTVAVNEGGSSLPADLRPEHLLRSARITPGGDAAELLPGYAGIVPWTAPTGPVPPYPVAGTHVPDATGGQHR